MQFVKLVGNTYCLLGNSVITVYDAGAGKCVLLDSGSREEGDEIIETLDKAGLQIGAMLCTHAHHDHFGNARYFAGRFGLPVILPLAEAAACISPANMCIELGTLSPGFVWTNPRLKALLGPADGFVWPDQDEISFLGVKFRVLHTRGHSPGHISIITPDNVCHAGDCLMAGEEFHASRFPYTCAYLDDVTSKRGIAASGAEVCVVSHRGIVYGKKDIAALVDENIRNMEDCLADVLSCIDKPITMDELSAEICMRRGIHSSSEIKLKIVHRTLNAMVEYLIDFGKIRRIVENGRFIFLPVPVAEQKAIDPSVPPAGLLGRRDG